MLEHANYTLLLEGVSRSLTHELVRHRAGFAYSQLSQRYVDESHAAFVMPPAILGDARLEAALAVGSRASHRMAVVEATGAEHGPVQARAERLPRPAQHDDARA